MNGLHVMDNRDRDLSDKIAIVEDIYGSSSPSTNTPGNISNESNISNISNTSNISKIPERELLTDYTDETIELINEVNRNRELRHAQVPPLRFCEKTLTGEPLPIDPPTESIRNRIWEYWYEQGLSTQKIGELLHIGNATLSRHLSLCKRRFDEWIQEYGLTVYGNPAQRLDDLLREYTQMLGEIDRDLINQDGELSIKEKNSLRKSRIEILDRIAKYQAIEPPKSVDITVHTPAEETRNKMTELFPDQSVDPINPIVSPIVNSIPNSINGEDREMEEVIEYHK